MTSALGRSGEGYRCVPFRNDFSGALTNGGRAGRRRSAMAMVTAAREPSHQVVAFSHGAAGEWVPTRIAAGNRGRYPANGSVRIRVTPECAIQMTDTDGEWCSVVAARPSK